MVYGEIKRRIPEGLSVAFIRRMFVHRDDVFAVQKSDGSYTVLRRPFTDQDIIDHLRGQHTIGLYCLKHDGDESTLKWAVLDIDIHKSVWSKVGYKESDWKEQLDEQVARAQTELSQYGIYSYVEESGNKGRHIWVFFDKPINGMLAKRCMEAMFGSMRSVAPGTIDWEIFPKQGKLVNEDSLGNLVKLPFGVHQKSQRESVFHELEDFVSQPKFATEQQLTSALNPMDAIFQRCEAFRMLRDKGLSGKKHLIHDERLALAYIFWNLPDSEVKEYDAHEGAKYIEEKIFSKLSDYDPKIIRDYYQHHKLEKTDDSGGIKQGYSPITCAKLQEQKICPGPCAAIGNSKSPIALYYKALGKERKEDDYDFSRAIYRPDRYFIAGRRYMLRGERKKNQKTGSYFLEDDTVLSNFVIRWDRHIRYDDGIVTNSEFEGVVMTPEHDRPIPIRIEAEKFANELKFRTELYNIIGTSVYIENDKKLREAVSSLTNPETIEVRKMFGYNEELTTYYSPSVMVTADFVRENDELTIDLSGTQKAEHLDLVLLKDVDFRNLVQHIKDDVLQIHNQWFIGHTAFAHAMMPIIAPFLEGEGNRYIFHLKGLTGSGKSFVMKHMQNFYGNYKEKSVSFTSTPNSIQYQGYYFKDAVYLVDDYKEGNIKNIKDLRGVLQNYTDEGSRDRLNADATGKPSRWIRGWLCMTGEDTVEGEASNLARMITITIPNAKKRMDKGNRMRMNRHMYPGYTARYIQYILNHNRHEISKVFNDYIPFFYKFVEGMQNDARMAQNVSMLMTSYKFAVSFLYDDNREVVDELVARMEEFLKDLMLSLIEEAAGESAAELFWDQLTTMLAKDQIYFQSGAIAPSDAMPKRGECIGYSDKRGNLFILGRESFDMVKRRLRMAGRDIEHSQRSVFEDLYNDGKIMSNKAVPRKMNGKSVKVYQLSEGILDSLEDE